MGNVIRYTCYVSVAPGLPGSGLLLALKVQIYINPPATRKYILPKPNALGRRPFPCELPDKPPHLNGTLIVPSRDFISVTPEFLPHILR